MRNLLLEGAYCVNIFAKCRRIYWQHFRAVGIMLQQISNTESVVADHARHGMMLASSLLHPCVLQAHVHFVALHVAGPAAFSQLRRLEMTAVCQQAGGRLVVHMMFLTMAL